MKRAAWALFWLLAVAVLTGVAWLLANRFLPEKPITSKPGPVALTPPTEADYKAWTSNSFAGSPWERQALVDEAALIAKNPGIAERDGPTLRLFYRGKLIATLTSSRAKRTSTLLVKVLHLYDASSGRPENVAEIRGWFGEFDNTAIVMPDGSQYPVGTASAAPGGKWLVKGQQDWTSSDPTDLVTWPDLTVVARFKPSCHVLSWIDETHFNARCGYQGRDGWQLFNAKVSRDDSGHWQMQSAGSLPENADEVEAGLGPPPPPDYISKDPHLHFTATVPANRH